MKDFRTELIVEPAHQRIGLKSSLFTQGSCFAEAIGRRLATYKLRTIVNPFGVIYNPESIQKALSYSIFNESLPDHTFLQRQEVHLNYNFHSHLADLSREGLMGRLSNTIGAAHYFLKDTDWLLLTFGTAWVYQRRDTGEIVANCHKLPQQMFLKSLLTPGAIVSSFRNFYDQLKRFNPKIRIIMTVSPVRHLKDTLELNSAGKAVLRVACHEISQQLDDAEYFPAYELMVDDLRDYRFYKRDMLHPTGEAEDYIWDKFMERYFSEELKDFVKKWDVILTAIGHKPFHAPSKAHQQFLLETLKKLRQLEEVVDVTEEMSLIQQQIIR